MISCIHHVHLRQRFIGRLTNSIPSCQIIAQLCQLFKDWFLDSLSSSGPIRSIFFFRELANKTLFMTYSMLCPSKEVGKQIFLKRYSKNNNHNKNALRRSPLRLTMDLNIKPITLTVETGESWLTRATISFSFLHDTNAFIFARVRSAVVNYEWD